METSGGKKNEAELGGGGKEGEIMAGAFQQVVSVSDHKPERRYRAAPY